MGDFSQVESVMDLGCGHQASRKFFSQEIKYFPVDLHKYDENVIVKDFNNNEFLNVDVDLILCSGIFEYIHDCEWFVKNICTHSKKYILASYHFKEDTGKNRANIWVNNLKSTEFIKLFEKNGFILEKSSEQQGQNQFVQTFLLFKKI
jgi:hypothetical protein